MCDPRQPLAGRRGRRSRNWAAEGDAAINALAGKEGEAQALLELRQAGGATADAVEAETVLNRGTCFHRALASYFCFLKVRHGPEWLREMPAGLDPDTMAAYVGHLRVQAGISYSTSTVASPVPVFFLLNRSFRSLLPIACTPPTFSTTVPTLPLRLGRGSSRDHLGGGAGRGQSGKSQGGDGRSQNVLDEEDGGAPSIEEETDAP